MPRVNNLLLQATYAAMQARMLSVKFEPILPTAHCLQIPCPAHASKVSLMNLTIAVLLPIWSISALTVLQVRRMPQILVVSFQTPQRAATMSSCLLLLLHPCSLSLHQLHRLPLRLQRDLHHQHHPQSLEKEKGFLGVQLLEL